MPLHFSAAACSFYDDDIHASMPSDVRPVTAEAHRALMQAQVEGKIIAANDDGDPIAINRPAPSWPEAWSRNHRRRNQLLRDSDWTQTLDCPLSEAERAAWALYRQALRDLPSTTTDPMAIVWPVAPT